MDVIGTASEWVPRACTLPTAEQPLRVAEFDAFFADAVRATRRPRRTRLELVIASDAEPIGRDLAARETDCCSFFAFGFISGDAESVMRIDVPEAHTDVLDALAARAAPLAEGQETS